MKALIFAAGTLVFCNSVLALPATTDAAGSSPGIAGVLDPSTGTFTTRPTLAIAAAALKRTGSVTVTTTVAIDSQIPADQTITCSVTLTAADLSFTNTASGSNNVIRSGSSGTCKTTIFYVWEVSSASTTMGVLVTVSTGSGFEADTVSHSAGFSFAPFVVPNAAKSLSVALAL